MENKKENTLVEDVALALTQIESMLKSTNSMLMEKITEGDITSSSIAFSNAILISFIHKTIDGHIELGDYIKSDEFKEKLSSMLTTQQPASPLIPEKKTNLN